VTLSVVIAAHGAAEVIETCLGALEPQRHRITEVILADSSADGTAEIVGTRFPWVRMLHFQKPLTLPQLRGRAIATAAGDVIAILDPYSVAAPDWAERVCEVHRARPHLVIGGSVGLYQADRQGWSAWVLYLNEYGLFMPPVTRGETWILPGSNVSYKRRALYDGTEPRYRDFWKAFVNWELERSGSAMFLSDTVHVDLNKPIPLADYFRTRYDHGRCFAGMRVSGAPPFTRIVRILSTAAVPFALMWRWTRGFWPKGHHRMRFTATLPAQIALFGMWALGEACGYFRGSGKSCGRLFY
jgi:glycosyltransferase involved in cell wall biosynthesis